MKKLLCILLLSCLASQAFAMKVGGVALPEKVQVGKNSLVLNGAGIRTKVIFNVYVASLYLTAKTRSDSVALEDKGAKRISLNVLRHVSAGDFMEAFNKAINDNHTPEEYAPLAARLVRFGRSFREVGEVNKGSTIIMDYLPELGVMVLTVNGKEITRIEGADFFTAMMKIWLGKNPVQDSLKKEMLGD
jgi:hypothetical protein